MNKFLRLCFLELLTQNTSEKLKVQVQDRRTGNLYKVHVDYEIVLHHHSSTRDFPVSKHHLGIFYKSLVKSPFKDLATSVMARYLLTGSPVTIVEKSTGDRYSAYINFIIRTDNKLSIDLHTFEQFYIFTEQVV